MAQFDHMIASPPAPIVPNDQPPALQTLQAKSGKSINATNEEFDNAVKDAEQELMMNPPNMANQDIDVDFLAKVKAYNKLSEEYDNGEDPSSNEDDDEIMDNLFGDEPMDNGQAQEANDFNMFAPDEQSSVDQMFSDIDTINANEPYTEEEDVAPLDMDALADIAEGEEDNNDNPMDELGAANSPPTQAVDKLDETVGSWSQI